jgi:hypothetical protein
MSTPVGYLTVESRQSMTLDELEDSVEKIIDAVSNHIVHEWLDDLRDDLRNRGFEITDEGADENETLFTLAFWDAARHIVRDLIVQGHKVKLAQK